MQEDDPQSNKKTVVEYRKENVGTRVRGPEYARMGYMNKNKLETSATAIFPRKLQGTFVRVDTAKFNIF